VAATGFFDTSVQPYERLGTDAAFHDLRAVMALLSPQDAELAADRQGTAGMASQPPVLRGLRRAIGDGPCRLAKVRCRPATPSISRARPGGDHADHLRQQLLMGRGPTWPEGMYSLLARFRRTRRDHRGGGAARGVRRIGGQGRRGQLPRQPALAVSGIPDAGCRARPSAEEITLDPEELQDARWVSREDMVAAYAGEHALIKPGRRGAIAQFLISNWLADRLD